MGRSGQRPQDPDILEELLFHVKLLPDRLSSLGAAVLRRFLFGWGADDAHGRRTDSGRPGDEIISQSSLDFSTDKQGENIPLQGRNTDTRRMMGIVSSATPMVKLFRRMMKKRRKYRPVMFAP
jgi:hypothetical protein